MAEFADLVPLIDDAVAAQPKNNFTIGGVVKDLVGFAIGMKVLGHVSKLGARGIFKSVVKNNANFGASILKHAGVAEAESLNLGSLFRGVRQTLADHPNGVFNMTTDNGKNVMEALSSASKASLNVGKEMRNTYARLANSQSIAARATAKMGKAFYKNLPFAAGWYGASRALGMGDKDKQYPAWYNIPGNVAEIAKETANFAAFDIGTGGLKHVGGFVKGLASKYLSEEASPGLHAFMDKHFAVTHKDGHTQAGSFLKTVLRGAAVLDGIRESARRTSGTITDTFMRNWGNVAKRNQQSSNLFDFGTKRFYSNLRDDANNGFKSAYRSRMNALRDYRSDYAHDFVLRMHDMISKHTGIDTKTIAAAFKDGHYGDLPVSNPVGGKIDINHRYLFGKHSTSLLHEMGDYLERESNAASHTMGASVFKRKAASVHDIFTGADRSAHTVMFSYLKNLAQDTTQHVELDNLMHTFHGLSAGGKNVYKSATGGVVDYGMWNPKNLMGSFLRFANPYLTVGVLGHDLPVMKILGMQQYMAKEGLNMHTIRADEGQIYYDKDSRYSRVVGDAIGNEKGKIGGMLIDGQLHTVNEAGVFVKANTNKMRMVISTPYARDSVLYKLNANPNNYGDALKKIKSIEDSETKRSFGDKISGFADRWGLKMPSFINTALEGLSQHFGFMPMRKGSKLAVDKILDPRSSITTLRGDASAFIGTVAHVADKENAKLYRSLSSNTMLDMIGRLSKDIGHDAPQRIADLKKAFNGTDEEVMDLIRSNGWFRDDDQMRYALEHHSNLTNSADTEQIGTKFSFRDRPLTHREEIQRRMLNKTLGDIGLPTEHVDPSSGNIATRMLNDHEILSNLSPEEQRQLKLTATKIDLHRHGHLGEDGNVITDYSSVAKKDAFDLIRGHMKGEQQYLESKFLSTPLIHEIGTLGFGRKAYDKEGFSEIFAKAFEDENKKKFSGSPFIMMDQGETGIGFKVNSFIDRVMDMSNHFGLRYEMKDRQPYTFNIGESRVGDLFKNLPIVGDFLSKKRTIGGPLAYMTKRVAQGIGVMAAAQALDTFTDVNPMFNGTILDHGIFPAVADVYVTGSMAYHKLQDLSGITGAAKYLEGLMPSSTSTIPGMILGGMTKGPLGILPGAVINRLLSANGVTPQFDKSYDDIKNTYSGRELVPMKRNRFWLFSKAPYEGDGPMYYSPHWYPKLKSQYKYTDTLYGSKAEAFLYKPWTGLGINPIGQILDKYHYEKKHYWDRPYAVTTPAWSELPIVGPILSNTIGRLPIIGKPIKHMHMDEMKHYFSMSNNTASSDTELSSSHMPTVDSIENMAIMNQPGNSNSAAALYGPGATAKNMNPYGMMTMLGEQLYNATEFVGLRGYQLESLMGGGLSDMNPRLQGAGDMWSARRAYWDMNLGDIFGSCFVKGTKVVTATGRKCIENIELNEDIITIDGTTKKVIGKLKKENQCNIYNLKCTTVDVELKVTEKHHFPIYKRYPCHEQNIRPCIPGNKKHCTICTKKDRHINVIDTPIENIKKGDFVCLPIIQPITRDIFIGGKVINSDIAYFLGWYVAEGCSDKYRITLSMNINELDYANRLSDIIKTNFGKNVQIKIIVKDSNLLLRFSDKKIASELKEMFGHGAKNKFIPYIIKTLPHDILKQFFKGCVLGDGFSNLKTSGFTSASSDLCRDLFDIGLSLGFMGHLVIDYLEKGKGLMPQGTLRKDSIRSYISWNQVSVQIYNLLYDKNEPIKILKKNGKSFIYNNMLFVQVKSNIRTSMISDVYDLEIEDKHYYMVEHIVTHNTEFFRRFVPKEKKIWKKVNPIRNRMPNWLPSSEGDYFTDFLTGDPFSKVPEGEIRLPGNAYNKLYDVKRAFPGRASSIGNNVMESVREMLGMDTPFDTDADDVTEAGTAIHRVIQDNLLKANIGIKAEILVYDAKDDISGHMDLLMHDPYRKDGKRVLEIKTVSGKKFAGIKSPIPHHVSQVNFYLRQQQVDMGTILYINRDDLSQMRTFDVRYNKERFRKDVQDLNKARKIAAGLVAKGEGFETGTSYSWLDRMRILGDVAPYSNEYRDAEKIVSIQMRDHQLSEHDIAEIQTIKKHRNSVMRKYDLYPTRFKSRVFHPDTRYDLQSENENLKAAANYGFGERVLGSIWERGIQMNTPLNTKLWNYQSPLQHYKNTKIYGSESAAWNKPLQDIVHPMMTKALASDNPTDSAAAFGWIGGLGIGGMGNMSLPGAVFGALYGAARTVVGPDAWIPDEINKKREIARNFDQLKYMKNMNLYEQTGDARYQTEATNTLWNISHSGYDVSVSQAMKSLSSFEKPYFLSWMNETNPSERQHILQMVPREVGNLLKAKWGLSYDLPEPSKFEAMAPDSTWEGLMPNDNLSDIEVKTINQEGLRATDFGLGWYDQQRRMANSQFDLHPVKNVSQVTSNNHMSVKLKESIMRYLQSIVKRPLIAVSVTPGDEDAIRIKLTLNRDRFNDIKRAMKAR